MVAPLQDWNNLMENEKENERKMKWKRGIEYIDIGRSKWGERRGFVWVGELGCIWRESNADARRRRQHSNLSLLCHFFAGFIFGIAAFKLLTLSRFIFFILFPTYFSKTWSSYVLSFKIGAKGVQLYL